MPPEASARNRWTPPRTSISASLGLVGPLWDWLTEIDASGKLSPGLALSWTAGADGKSWTFKLRPGVKFHDGSEMSAEDVQFTLMEGFRRPKAKASRVRQFRKGIKDVKVIDAHTVTVVTAKPWPTFPYDMSFQPGIEGIVLPKAYIKKVGWDGFAQKPVGTGPWKFVKHEVGNFIEFEAVKDHWRKSPNFDRLRTVLVKEAATRVAMLKTGQVDVARISLDEVQDVTKAGLKIAEDPQPTSVRIHLYATYYDKAGPVKDVRVRQALNLAVNRQEIVDTLLHGKGKPAAVFPSSPISIGYPADLKPYPYDPAKARKLLAEAGYPNGFSIKLFALPTGGFTQFLQLAEIVAGYWEAIGVKTSIIPTDIGAFRPLYIANPQSPKIVGAGRHLRHHRTAQRLRQPAHLVVGKGQDHQDGQHRGRHRRQSCGRSHHRRHRGPGEEGLHDTPQRVPRRAHRRRQGNSVGLREPGEEHPGAASPGLHRAQPSDCPVS